jgi:hypothetical protein
LTNLFANLNVFKRDLSNSRNSRQSSRVDRHVCRALSECGEVLFLDLLFELLNLIIQLTLFFLLFLHFFLEFSHFCVVRTGRLRSLECCHVLVICAWSLNAAHPIPVFFCDGHVIGSSSLALDCGWLLGLRMLS